MTPLLLAAVLSTAIPAQRIDDTWGALVRSTHLYGRWQLALGDGTRLSGDWIVINREPRSPYAPIYFLDSTTSTRCWAYAVKPVFLQCVAGPIGDHTRNLIGEVRVGSAFVLNRGSTPLSRDHCKGSRCRARRAGSIEVDVQPKSLSFADAVMLFERIAGTSIASIFKTPVRKDGGTLVFDLPFRERSHLPRLANSVCAADEVTEPGRVIAQDNLDAIATVRLGPLPHQVAITARVTAHTIEECVQLTRTSGKPACAGELKHCGT
ncbi:MAG: hypothetical protein M3680_19355 [Myxococcota bacterium]|nr:hypothetical protein [Myxococcota bacterium]